MTDDGLAVALSPPCRCEPTPRALALMDRGAADGRHSGPWLDFHRAIDRRRCVLPHEGFRLSDAELHVRRRPWAPASWESRGRWPFRWPRSAA